MDSIWTTTATKVGVGDTVRAALRRWKATVTWMYHSSTGVDAWKLDNRNRQRSISLVAGYLIVVPMCYDSMRYAGAGTCKQAVLGQVGLWDTIDSITDH